MKHPQRVPLDGMPPRVTIYEVGPRDGLQNEQAVVSVDDKARFVRGLAAAGLPVIETTSFVSPSWVPQLADADRLLEVLGPEGVGEDRPVLVPNLKGLERAQACGVRHIAVFASATETFARRNLNRSLAESLEMFRPVVAQASGDGLRVRAYISMCFGDPWEGPVDPANVADVAATLTGWGCDQVSLGDTIGVATPGQVAAVIDVVAGRIGVERLAVHFHDTYGQALSNTVAALSRGVETVDASAGGLGGCPYAGSATGNLATEDLVWALHGMGVETGVDLEALVAVSDWMSGVLGRPGVSRVVRALGSDRQ